MRLTACAFHSQKKLGLPMFSFCLDVVAPDVANSEIQKTNVLVTNTTDRCGVAEKSRA